MCVVGYTSEPWNRSTTKAARYEFTAARDENGVPHVEAPSWREALYAWGYMHAIDRPTQVYFARAVASGQATERIANKPELLEMDIFLRRAGLYRDLDREYPPAARDHARAARLVLPGRQRRPLRRRPHAADVGHRFPPAAVGAVSRAAHRQAAELRRPLDRRAGERAAAAGADSTGRRRRAAARAVPPVPRRHRFRAAPRDSHRQAAVGRSAGTAGRLAAAGRQQRLGREPGAQCDRSRAVGFRSALGSESVAVDLVRNRAQLGRRRVRDGRDAARLPDHGRRPHEPTGVGRHVHARRHERLISSKIAGQAAPAAGNIGAAINGSISSIARK